MGFSRAAARQSWCIRWMVLRRTFLVDFVPSRIRDFAWSPSGDQFAVLREHSTSDVVLITDQDAKASH